MISILIWFVGLVVLQVLMAGVIRHDISSPLWSSADFVRALVFGAWGLVGPWGVKTVIVSVKEWFRRTRQHKFRRHR
jgi:hypothetical protein